MRVGAISLDSVMAFPGKRVQLLEIEKGQSWGPEQDRWGVIAFYNLMSQLTVLLYWC